MIWFILGIIIGAWLGWKYEHIVNDIIETIKIHLNLK